MLLCIDVGNTNITVGIYDGDKLMLTSRLSTDKKRTGDQYAIELASLLKLFEIDISQITGAIMSSVVPELTLSLKRAVRRLCSIEVLCVSIHLKTNLTYKTDNAEEIGPDLIACAVAAVERYPMPCVIFDLGTATTVTIIDKTGAFIGCVIAVGVEVSMEALSGRASMLPHIGIEAPNSVIATNSADCMRSGAVYGTAAMLDGLATRIERELGSEASLIATGGLSSVIIPYCEKNVEYTENLLLDGLKIIYELNKGGQPIE